MKILLASKRLSMLQDDHDSPLILSPEIPVPHKSLSTKSPRDIDDHEVVISTSSKNRMKYGSHKRGRVLSDAVFEEYREPIKTPFQSQMKKSQKRAKVGNSNESLKRATKISASLQLCKKRSPAMKKAEDIQAKLSTKYPSFIKLMLKSHVSGGFWLGLPSNFCEDHLPQVDTDMELVDEARKKSNSKYLAVKRGLSAGWRGFSIAHKLLEGDVLVFHLIACDKFKIYIVRARNCGTVDGALGPRTLDYDVEHNIEDSSQNLQEIEDTHTLVDNLPPSSSDAKDECAQKARQIEDVHTLVDKPPQSSSDPELSPEVLNEIKFSDSVINFERVKSFENFNITVDGLILDSKFSDSTRMKYYELCNTQKSFLHEHLLKGLNCDLVVGTISEIVNISDAVSACKVGGPASRENLLIWERTLEGFEFLGMKVAFLQARVKELMGIATDHSAEESNRLKEIIIKRVFAREKMKALEKKFAELKERAEMIDFEVEAEIRQASAWKQEANFKKISTAVM